MGKPGHSAALIESMVRYQVKDGLISNERWPLNIGLRQEESIISRLMVPIVFRFGSKQHNSLLDELKIGEKGTLCI